METDRSTPLTQEGPIPLRIQQRIDKAVVTPHNQCKESEDHRAKENVEFQRKGGYGRSARLNENDVSAEATRRH